jgi:hypothetical protein
MDMPLNLLTISCTGKGVTNDAISKETIFSMYFQYADLCSDSCPYFRQQ